MAADVAHTVCKLGYKFSFKTGFSFLLRRLLTPTIASNCDFCSSKCIILFSYLTEIKQEAYQINIAAKLKLLQRSNEVSSTNGKLVTCLM